LPRRLAFTRILSPGGPDDRLVNVSIVDRSDSRMREIDVRPGNAPLTIAHAHEAATTDCRR
jgi:hypothetical protein